MYIIDFFWYISTNPLNPYTLKPIFLMPVVSIKRTILPKLHFRIHRDSRQWKSVIVLSIGSKWLLYNVSEKISNIHVAQISESKFKRYLQWLEETFPHFSLPKIQSKKINWILFHYKYVLKRGCLISLCLVYVHLTFLNLFSRVPVLSWLPVWYCG